MQKFTRENIIHYENHLDFMWNLGINELMRVKYIDESHIDDKNTYAQKGFSPISEPNIQMRGIRLEHPASITLVTSIDNNTKMSLAFSYRENSNTSEDFLAAVEEFIEMGFLRRLVILIMDNAPVHVSEDSERGIREIEQEEGITILKQPKYSPELNACELVFGDFKNHFRKNRVNTSILEALLEKGATFFSKFSIYINFVTQIFHLIYSH